MTLAWLFGKRHAEVNGDCDIAVEIAVEIAAAFDLSSQPQIEYTGEEEWEWEARRCFMKVMQGVDIGDWPHENADQNQEADHETLESEDELRPEDSGTDYSSD